jgi:23S rRNA U2552 (ribose-2'-O)-methylase RlmE/FtsJ
MSYSRIAFVSNTSTIERAAQFLSDHPAVASIDEVDAPFGAGRKISTQWIIVTLRDASTAETFISDLAKRPSFFKAVHRIMPIEKELESWEELLLDPRLKQHSFRVHAYPPAVVPNAIDCLDKAGVRLEPARATHQLTVLAIYRRDPLAEPNRLSFSHLVTSQSQTALQPRPPLRILYSIVPSSVPLVEGPGPYIPHICRAYSKIEEVFDFHLAGQIPFSESRALDIGAAPGGWTEYLQVRCKEVVAIDPGEMNAELLAQPNVRHMRQLAEEATPQLLKEQPFDIMCCDMNQSYGESIERMSALAVLLRPGAVLCFTLKSQHVGKKISTINAEVAIAIEKLSTLFENMRVVWLWSNSERERTVIAFRRASAQ